MRRSVLLVCLAAFWLVPAAMAHPHEATPGHQGEGQLLANGQNHPGFVGNVSCEGVNEPANSGPAGYGLETAHHGPDAGTPGKADGCFEREGVPDDENPAID